MVPFKSRGRGGCAHKPYFGMRSRDGVRATLFLMAAPYQLNFRASAHASRGLARAPPRRSCKKMRSALRGIISGRSGLFPLHHRKPPRPRDQRGFGYLLDRSATLLGLRLRAVAFPLRGGDARRGVSARTLRRKLREGHDRSQHST